MEPPLRIGILGAARIAPMALVRPARQVPDARVVAVAARDRTRAERFAAKHGVPRVHASYEALLEDGEIDAIYNPLPNGLHGEWTLRALAAGKHVLCEKPMASNAAEALRMAEAAEQAGRVLVEAFHWRYHPLAARLREIVRGEIGALQHVEATMCIPLLLPGDIRYRLDLAGGAMMDTGCYVVNVVRWLAEAEPEVVSAEARLSSPGVDRFMRAALRFPNGATGRITCALATPRLLHVAASARGSEGEMRVLNPIVPHFYHRLRVRTPSARRSERVPGDATYTHQLRAFVAHVRGGTRMSSDARDAVANMRIIDAVYEKAGLPLRGAAGEGPPPASASRPAAR
jgi:predicted dehydrogenase